MWWWGGELHPDQFFWNSLCERDGPSPCRGRCAPTGCTAKGVPFHLVGGASDVEDRVCSRSGTFRSSRYPICWWWCLPEVPCTESALVQTPGGTKVQDLWLWTRLWSYNPKLRILLGFLQWGAPMEAGTWRPLWQGLYERDLTGLIFSHRTEPGLLWYVALQQDQFGTIADHRVCTLRWGWASNAMIRCYWLISVKVPATAVTAPFCGMCWRWQWLGMTSCVFHQGTRNSSMTHCWKLAGRGGRGSLLFWVWLSLRSWIVWRWRTVLLAVLKRQSGLKPEGFRRWGEKKKRLPCSTSSSTPNVCRWISWRGRSSIRNYGLLGLALHWHFESLLLILFD